MRRERLILLLLAALTLAVYWPVRHHEFILFDDMQYTRRDWRNRNQIKTPQGRCWLTIPVDVKGKYLQKIRETTVSDAGWAQDHWKTIRQFYARARYFDDYREEFEELCCQFVRQQQWWDDSMARSLFEVDLINKPYVYSNTPFKPKRYAFEKLQVGVAEAQSYTVKVPEECLPYLSELIGPSDDEEGQSTTFRVNHKRTQYPYMKAQSLEHNAAYCHGMVIRIEHMAPVWVNTASMVNRGLFARIHTA